MLEQLQVLRDQLTDALAIIDDMQRNACEVAPAVLSRHADAISCDVPAGWDTVLGYLAKVHPDVLDSFDYSVPEATVRDGWKLSHMARKRGYAERYAVAPMVLQRAGVLAVRMYPVSLLAQRWR